jgi:hypothetical protein
VKASGVVAPQPLQCDGAWLGVCVCTVSQGAHLRAAEGALVALCTPVLLDCRGRREKRWEWQPKLTRSSHVCGCVASKHLSPRYQHAQLHQPVLSRTPALFSRWACAHTVSLGYELINTLIPKALSQVLEGALLRLFI